MWRLWCIHPLQNIPDNEGQYTFTPYRAFQMMSKLWLQNAARTCSWVLCISVVVGGLSMPVTCGMIDRKRKASWLPMSVLLTSFPLTIFPRHWFCLLHSLKSQSDQFLYFSTSCSECLWHCLALAELSLLPAWAIPRSGERDQHQGPPLNRNHVGSLISSSLQI